MDTLLTIQQVAQATGLTEHTLRYYERIGLILSIHRLENTHRRYSETDVGWINFLNRLRATGMSIQQMCTYAELQRQGDSTLPQRLAMLKEHREKVVQHIAALNEHLDILNWKVDNYEKLILDAALEPQN